MPFGSFPTVISQPTGGSGTSGGGTIGGTSGGGTSGGTSGGGTSGGTSGGTTVDAYTKAQSDAKYRTITDSYGKSDPWTNNGTGVILVKQPYSIRTIQGISPVSVVLDGTNNMVQVSVDSYTKNESDTKYRTITDSYTRTESDNAYRTKADSYSKSESDTTFLKTQKVLVAGGDQAANGHSLVESDHVLRRLKAGTNVTITPSANQLLIDASGGSVVDAYTKTQSDGKYRTIDDSYTKAVSNTRYYTKTECDGLFALKTTPVIPPVITTTSAMLADDPSFWFQGALSDHQGGWRVDRLTPARTYTMDSPNAFPAIYIDLSLLSLPDQVGTYTIYSTGDINKYVRVNVKFASNKKVYYRNADDPNWQPHYYGTDGTVYMATKFVFMQYTNSMGISMVVDANGEMTVTGALTVDYPLYPLLSLKPELFYAVDLNYRGWKLSAILDLCSTATEPDNTIVFNFDTQNALTYSNLYVDSTDTYMKWLNKTRKFRMHGFPNNFGVFARTKAFPGFNTPNLTVLDHNGNAYASIDYTEANAGQLVELTKNGKYPYLGYTAVVECFIDFNIPSKIQIQPSSAFPWQEGVM